MLAIASWEKGASRVIDCVAIGGLAGGILDQGWVGENADRSDRAMQPLASRSKSTILCFSDRPARSLSRGMAALVKRELSRHRGKETSKLRGIHLNRKLKGGYE